jgi:prepilin-type processing-associated H-X9-DG protein
MNKGRLAVVAIVVTAAVALCGSAWAQEQAIAGIVVDAEENPVAGAKIKVLTMELGTIWQFEVTAETETGADGRFSLTPDSEKMTGFFSFYAVQHPDYGLAWTMREALIQMGQDPSDLRLVMPKRGSVQGKVADSEGNPVEGAVLSAFITLPTGSVDEPLRMLPPCEGLLKATTGADGTFVLEGLPADASVMLVAKHPDFAAAVEGAPEDMMGFFSGEIAVGTEDVAVTLEPGATIEGRITLEETGEPAEGATVQAMVQRNDFTALLARPEQSETDSGGHYILRSVAAGTHSIAVTHPDGAIAPVTVEVSVGEHKTGQDIVLGRGVLVSGKFVDRETGEPVSDGHLVVARTDAMDPAGFTSAKVESDGTFSFRQAPGDYALMAQTGAGSQSGRQLTLVAGEDQTDLILETEQRVLDFRAPEEQRLSGAQAFELEVAEWIRGEATSLEELQGTIVVLAFLDSADDSAAEVIGALNALAEDRQDVAVIAVHSAECDPDALREFIEEENITFGVAVDTESSLAFPGLTFESYRVRKAPAVFIIDPGSTVRYQDIPLGALEAAIDNVPKEVDTSLGPRKRDASASKASQGPTSRDRALCANHLKQMGLVFRMYANESRGERWPRIDDRRYNLMVDGQEIYPEYLTDINILRCPGALGGEAQPPLRMPDDITDESYFYLGWAIATEDEGLALLDMYESLEPAQRDEDLPRDESTLSEGEGVPVLYRLREGVERFFITDINNPAGSALATSMIPVMWERPGNHEPSGGNVLFMDGHVEYLRYPGKFPMTQAFIERCEEISAKKEPVSVTENQFTIEFEKAAKVIAERDEWPDSPEKVAEAFWQARYAKDYSEMEILWPGSASIGWPAICANDPDVKYVFGKGSTFETSNAPHGASEECHVPYASEEDFQKTGKYNLKMRLRDLQTPRGKRWYVVSGN